MSANLGTAWIQIKPSLDGVQQSINKQLKGTGTSVSNNISKEIVKNTAIGTAFGVAIMKGVTAIAGKLSKSVGDIVRGAMGEMDSIVRSSNALEQMGYSTDDVNKKITQLRKNANKTAATTGDLTEGFLALTASWKDINLTADATQALSDAILSFGGTPDQVANAITQISQVDIDGPLDAQTWLSLRNSGLIPALGTLAKMNGMELGEFKKALGSGQLTTRDFIDGLIQLDQQGSDTQSSFEKIAQSNAAATWSGSWETAKNTVVSALSQQLQKLWEVSGAGDKIIELGDNLSVVINVISNDIQNFIGWLNSGTPIADGFKAAIEGIALAISAASIGSLIGSLGKFIGKFVSFITLGHPVIAIIAAIGAGLVTFFTQTETGRQIIGNLVGWVKDTVIPTISSFFGWISGTALPTISSFFVTVKDKLLELAQAFMNSPIGKILKSLFNLIGSFAKLVISVIKLVLSIIMPISKVVFNIFSSIGSALKSFMDLVFTILQPIFGFIGLIVGSIMLLLNVITNVKNFIVGKVINVILDFIIFLYNSIINGITNVIVSVINFVSTVIGFFTTLADTIREKWQSLVDKIRNIWDTYGQPIVDTIKSAWNSIVDKVEEIKNNVKQKFSELWDGAKGVFSDVCDLGKNIVEGLVNGIKDKAKWAKDKIVEFCSGSLDKIKEFFGIHSPSRVMMEIGRYLDLGLIKGINKESDNVSKSIEDMSRNALSEMSALDNQFSLGVNRSFDVNVDQDKLVGNRSIVQNNNITITDGFDLKVAENKLAYAVSMS